MQDVFPIYEKLWRRAEDEGAVVFYNDLWPELAGFFRPSGDDVPQPQLTIYRQFCSDTRRPCRVSANAPVGSPAPDIPAELITLAHEFGHYLSWKGRTSRPEWGHYRAATDKFDAIREATDEEIDDEKDSQPSDRDARHRAALLAGLTDDDRARILAEEELAWDIGREVLAELGFDDFARYDEANKRGLHNYRYRFSMDDAWPDDE